MNLLFGFVQLLIAAVLLHKVMPNVETCAMRVWFFALGMASYGGASVIKGLGYGDIDLLVVVGHLSFIVAGLLWMKRAKGTWISATFK